MMNSFRLKRLQELQAEHDKCERVKDIAGMTSALEAIAVLVHGIPPRNKRPDTMPDTLP